MVETWMLSTQEQEQDKGVRSWHLYSTLCWKFQLRQLGDKKSEN